MPAVAVAVAACIAAAAATLLCGAIVVAVRMPASRRRSARQARRWCLGVAAGIWHTRAGACNSGAVGAATWMRRGARHRPFG